jgi:hypothetical protein
MNAARYFMRREDYQPCQTPSESPFHYFDVKRLKCDCYKMTVTAHYDEQTGESFIMFFCSRCRQHEKIPIRL